MIREALSYDLSEHADEPGAIITVEFLPSATGAEVLAFLAKFEAVVVGGSELLQVYDIQFPDPGAAWLDFIGLIEQMQAEPAVSLVSPITSKGPT